MHGASGSIRRDGVTIAYQDGGGGDRPVAVLLHGLAGSSRELLATAAALPEYRCILIDQRGHGASTRRPADVTPEAFVADVAAVLAALAVDSAVVIGQSMGAYVALLLAATHPQLVRRLVLVEGGIGGADAAKNADVGAWFASWPAPFASRRDAAVFLGDGTLGRAWQADLEQAPDGWRPRFDADVMTAVLDELVATQWAEWEQVAAPTLLVHGGDFSAAERDEMLRHGRAARAVVIPHGSHDLHLDAHDAWVAALRDFVVD
ncbi:alpha/beta hydrolase [Microbacteriaceae bacterium VKM Ac-2855]|nr:alpha/beta hydrolase [Microbacteriaceae bacterium VKM Ac-2855]